MATEGGLGLAAAALDAWGSLGLAPGAGEGEEREGWGARAVPPVLAVAPGEGEPEGGSASRRFGA